jgi:hypothetical protein
MGSRKYDLKFDGGVVMYRQKVGGTAIGMLPPGQWIYLLLDPNTPEQTAGPPENVGAGEPPQNVGGVNEGDPDSGRARATRAPRFSRSRRLTPGADRGGTGPRKGVVTPHFSA